MIEKKKGIVLGGMAALAAFLLLKAKPAAAEGPAAAITLQVFDSVGNPVPANSPIDLIEGEAYKAVVTVINLSTKAGQPWGATFEIVVGAGISGAYDSVFYIELIPSVATQVAFLPQGSWLMNYVMMVVPLGAAGLSGQITVEVRDLVGNIIASVSEPLYVLEAPIIYEATVTVV